MIHLLQASDSWIDLSLKIIGAMAIFVTIFLAIYNRTRKQATTFISKTEAEEYKAILENKLAEINITEVIEKKVEHEVKPLKEMLWNREIEHYEVKKEMQERLMRELEEKKVIMRENDLLRNELEIMHKDMNTLRKEIDLLKKQTNGKEKG